MAPWLPSRIEIPVSSADQEWVWLQLEISRHHARKWCSSGCNLVLTRQNGALGRTGVSRPAIERLEFFELVVESLDRTQPQPCANTRHLDGAGGQ